MEAWYMDDSNEDQCLQHHLSPRQHVSKERLAELGVLHWNLDADRYESDLKLRQIRRSGGYTYQDIITVSPSSLPNFEEKIKCFYEEHIHLDDEIRFCLSGSGYFDIRDFRNLWIRMWVKKGDLIVLPAGSYHRFTLDECKYIKAMRLFVGDPVWTPFNRPQEENPARKEYVKRFTK